MRTGTLYNLPAFPKEMLTEHLTVTFERKIKILILSNGAPQNYFLHLDGFSLHFSFA